jgi:hypothetical protein
MSFLNALFYISAIFLAVVCTYTAASMSKVTCICIKFFMVLIIIGLTLLVCSVYYYPTKWHSLLSITFMLWGVTGWLFFDRYRAHEELDMLRDYLLDSYYEIKQWIVGHK